MSAAEQDHLIMEPTKVTGNNNSGNNKRRREPEQNQDKQHDEETIELFEAIQQVGLNKSATTFNYQEMLKIVIKIREQQIGKMKTQIEETKQTLNKKVMALEKQIEQTETKCDEIKTEIEKETMEKGKFQKLFDEATAAVQTTTNAIADAKKKESELKEWMKGIETETGEAQTAENKAIALKKKYKTEANDSLKMRKKSIEAKQYASIEATNMLKTLRANDKGATTYLAIDYFQSAAHDLSAHKNLPDLSAHKNLPTRQKEPECMTKLKELATNNNASQNQAYMNFKAKLLELRKLSHQKDETTNFPFNVPAHITSAIRNILNEKVLNEDEIAQVTGMARIDVLLLGV